MTNAEAYNNAPLSASIDAWTSFRNNIIMGHKPTFEEWLEYECDRMPTLRNCDVGTPEEQFELFSAFCKSGRQWDDEDYCSSKCPLDKRGGGCEVGCAFHWAQMPFAPAEGGKE